MQIPSARCGFLVFLVGTISGDLLLDTNLPGHDLKLVFAPDAEYCQLICTYHPLCTAFTFAAMDLQPYVARFSCVLKTNITGNPAAPVPLNNAISGYTLAKNAGNLTRCYPKIFPSISFPGSDVMDISVDDVAACQDACSRNPYCQFFTYNYNNQIAPPDNLRCFLKSKTMLASPAAILVQDGIDSGFSQRDCCSGNDCDQGCADVIIPNVDFQGTVVDQVNGSDWAGCQRACTRNPHCHFFTFYTNEFTSNSKRLTCYLRRSDLGVPTGSLYLENVKSGFTKKSSEFQKSEKECADFLLLNVDFQGNDIGSTLASNATHCQRLCTQHPHCQFFTFITEQWSSDNRKLTCQLKSSDKKIPENIYPLADVISGFSLTASGLRKSDAECANLLFWGMNFSGDDVMQSPATNATECQGSCTNHPACQFFFFNAGTSICFLKANLVGIPQVLQAFPASTSGFPLRASGTQKGDKGCTDLLLNGWDFKGTEIDRVYAIDVEHCRLLCMFHPNCLIFTYFDQHLNKFSCYLKTIDPSIPTNLQQKNMTLTGFSFVSPGIQKRCITQTYNGVGFAGESQRNFPVKSYESCQDACTEDPSCPFFSYRTNEFPTASMRGTCSLMYVNDLPGPTTVASSENPKSGFPLRKCEGDLPGYVPPLNLEVSFC